MGKPNDKQDDRQQCHSHVPIGNAIGELVIRHGICLELLLLPKRVD